MSESVDLDATERDALHELQLGTDHVHRAYGHLLSFHHAVGRAMDHFAEAERLFREADREDPAVTLRDQLLPAGVVGDRWSYEVVEEFESTFYRQVVDFESAVRADLADGLSHVAERDQQRRWRNRAEGWATDE
jgi:hypothetical protein